MIALLAVKRFLWTLLLAIPLIATLLVHRLGSSYLQRSWGVMGMRAAHELDVADAAAAGAVEEEQQQGQGGEQRQQSAGSGSGDGSSSSSSCGLNAAVTSGSVLHQHQQHQQAGCVSEAGANPGSSSSSCILAAGQQQQQQGSLPAAWGELYRPPGQRLLLLGPRIEAGLREQVQQMKQRLAEHNAAAAAASNRRRTSRPSFV